MLAAGKHVQLPEHAPAERVLRQHALDRELDHALGVLAEKILQSDRLYAADMAGMVVVDLVGELAPGDTDLLRIDHPDVVAHVHVRAVVSLVLALEAMSDLRGQPPERVVAGVDDEPIAPACRLRNAVPARPSCETPTPVSSPPSPSIPARPSSPAPPRHATC